jgi:hypothetical protein
MVPLAVCWSLRALHILKYYYLEYQMGGKPRGDDGEVMICKNVSIVRNIYDKSEGETLNLSICWEQVQAE